MTQFEIKFIPSGRGKAQNPPNPAHPEGIAVDTGARPACKAELPYPAPECGYYKVECVKCGASVIITSVGRPDDPVSIMIPCATSGGGKVI
jgi:hypothetical protein